MSVFKSHEDAKQAILWSKELLDWMRRTSHFTNNEMEKLVQDLLGEISEIEIQVQSNINQIDMTPLKSVLNEIKVLGEELSTSSDKQVYRKMLEADNAWRYRFESKQVLTVHGEDLTYHRFNIKDVGFEYVIAENPPDLFKFDLFKVSMGSQADVFVSSIPAYVLDFFSGVPALESKIDNLETSLRVLNPKRKKDLWQRGLNKMRMNSIASFFDRPDSFFVNPVIVHIRDTDNARINFEEKKFSLELDSDFLSNRNSMKNINGEVQDARPLVLVDGQHRVRGSSGSNSPNDPLMVVIIPSTYAEETVGKIFSEINTLSKELSKKHRIYLAHRFSISSSDPMYNFSKHDPTEPESSRGEANRRSYELAAKLSGEKGSPLHNSITILDQNKDSRNFYSIEKWLEYTYAWFISGPYRRKQDMLSDDYIFQEVRNYFSAWNSIIGDMEKDEQVLFKSNTQARVLLVQYTDVREYAMKIQDNNELVSFDSFLEALTPISQIPLDDKGIISAFKNNQKPETSWKMLNDWVSDSLETQRIHSREEILDTSVRGKAGKGILSKPAPREQLEYVIPEGGLKPAEGKAKYLEVMRPAGSSKTCHVSLFHKGEEVPQANHTYKTTTIDKSGNIPIRPSILKEYSEDLKIKVSWSTIVGSSSLEIEIIE